MAAGLYGSDKMASVREVPWHGMGTILPERITAKEMHDLCFPWTVRKSPVYADNGKQVPDVFVTIREDTEMVLGAVGPRYEPYQNWECAEFMETVCNDKNGPNMETSGSLFNGRRIWLLAKLPKFIHVTREDVVEEYLLLANGHDGSMALHMLWTPIRVVCQNTLSAGLQAAKGARFYLRHTKNLRERVDEAREILGLAADRHDEFESLIPSLLAYKPNSQEVDRVLDDLFKRSGLDDKKDKQKIEKLQYEKEIVVSSWKIDETNNLPGIEGTAWSLYNAITEHVDYFREDKRGATEDDRLDSNWFGAGANMKSRALDLVVALAR